MNTKSIRFRLAIWYAVVFFLATGVMFVSFHLVTQRALYDQVDNHLNSYSSKVGEIILRQTSDLDGAIAKQVLLQELTGIPGIEVIVMNRSGNIVSSSLPIQSEKKTFDQLYFQVVESKKPFFKNESILNSSLRILTTPVYQNDNLFAVVMVANPIDDIKESLDSLLAILGIFFLVLIIPTIGGVYLIAQEAIQPITLISNKLKKITSQNLEERVDELKTGDEIEELASTFNHLLDRLSDAFKREHQFISDVAHELKTPLSTMRSGIEVALLKKRDKEDYKKVLDDVLIDINRLSTTIKNILDLAWSEADNARMEREVINLSEMMEELKDTALKMAYGKKIKIQGIIKKDIFVPGKKDRLFRALLNIVENAIKYTKEGKIVISLQNHEQTALIKVKDTGEGILEADLPHITERFYRGSRTAKTHGSGLGLAITQAVITAHHGRLEIASKTGKGTQVAVILPILLKIS